LFAVASVRPHVPRTRRSAHRWSRTPPVSHCVHGTRLVVSTVPMHELFAEFRMPSAVDSTPARLLVADDQPDVLEALRWLLTAEGYEAEFVSSTGAVLERLRASPFDLLLMDLNYTRDTTSGREGLELITKVRALDGSLPIV